MSTALPTRLTDTDKLLVILKSAPDGWISHDAILRRCGFEYGHGMTVHSRAASLRKRGYGVECKVEKKDGRVVSYYRLAP